MILNMNLNNLLIYLIYCLNQNRWSKVTILKCGSKTYPPRNVQVQHLGLYHHVQLSVSKITLSHCKSSAKISNQVLCFWPLLTVNKPMGFSALPLFYISSAKISNQVLWFYRGKVMFLHLSVILFGGWGVLSRGLCPEGFCPGGSSLSRIGFLSRRGSLSRRGVSVQEGSLCPGGESLSRRVSVQGSLSRGGPCLGGLCPWGGLCPGDSFCPGGLRPGGGLCPGE